MVYTADLKSAAARIEGSSLSSRTILLEGWMKLWEATIRDPGPGSVERKARIGAETAEEARRLLQQLYGPRSVPYMPKQIPQ